MGKFIYNDIVSSLVSVSLQIKQQIDCRCLVRKIGRANCRVRLDGTPKSHIIVDFDSRYSPIEKRSTKCNFLYMDESRSKGHVVPLELKIQISSSSNIVNQLQAGADFVNSTNSESASIRFIPIVASRGIAKAARSHFRTSTIRFREEQFAISRMKCVDKLLHHLQVS